MKFKNWLNENNEALQSLVQRLKGDVPELVDLWAWETDDYVELAKIEIDPKARNQGIGTKVVEAIKQYASSVGKPVVLTPEPARGKKGALERFYRRSDFIPNKGRNKDFRLSRPFSSTWYWKSNN